MVTESNTKLMTEYVLETSHVESEKWIVFNQSISPFIPSDQGLGQCTNLYVQKELVHTVINQFYT